MDYLLGRRDFSPVEDMITLPELSEESLLLNLRMRYEKKQIYTYTGSILVAVNPYELLPIYTADIVKQYFAKQRGSLPPHIFAIADAAYTNMMEERKNQSIIISGESGAGKTESTKLIIQYLAARTNRHSQVEQMIVESSPILEAFGNAKTIRNNNSSRFGKFIEIQFNRDGHISGARIINYLLEKSRIVAQAKSERNYHIFYQLLAGLNEEQKQKLRLGEPDEYHYLNQSGCINIENINDVEDFEHVKYAMQVLGLPEDKQNHIFSILAAILHLGNVTFEKSEKTQGHEGSDVSNKDTLKIVAELLQLDYKKLEACLTNRFNMIRGQQFVVPLKTTEAEDARDALSKSLYGSVFNWLVTFINSRIHKPQPNTTFIGVLDIFGFENFKKNSFEQFCINFANEKLQQHFNQHIFKLEQEEYEKEKINWSKIVYNDNQECLDLIEKKPLGILSLLDEECRFPQATDITLLSKLHINHEKHTYYEKPKISKTTFVVKHYAGDVAYDTAGFLDKNKDTVSDDMLNGLLETKNKFIQELYKSVKDAKEEEDDDSKKKATVRVTSGNQFKTQLQSLINTLSSTSPHYVRCIKPNSTKEPGNFDEQLIQDQLRYAGMMETIRIRKTGYPIRHTHKEFRDRYLVLDYRARHSDMKQTCASLIHSLNSWEGIDKDEWQVGLTKIFIRDPQFRLVENYRKEKLVTKVTLIQSTWRMYKHRKRFLAIQKASKLLQTATRSTVARREFKEKRAATNTIKGFFKMIRQRKKFLTIKANWKAVPTAAKAFLARKKSSHLVDIKRDRNRRMEEIQREKDEEARKKKEAQEKARQEKEDQDRAAAEKAKLVEEAKKKEEEIKAKLKEEEEKKLEEKKAQLKELNQFEDISSLEKILKDQQAKNINELDSMVYSMEDFSFEGGVDDSQPYSYNAKMYEIDVDALDKLSITDLLQGLKQTVRSVTRFDVDDSKFELPPGIENVLKRAPGVKQAKSQLAMSQGSNETSSPPMSPPMSPPLSPPTSDASTPDISSIPLPPPSMTTPSISVTSSESSFLPPPPPSISTLPLPPTDLSSLPPPPPIMLEGFEIDPILGLPPPPPSSTTPRATTAAAATPVSSYQAQQAQQAQQLPHIIQDEEITLYSFYEYANKNFNQEKHKQKEDLFSYQKSHIKSSLLNYDPENTKLAVEIFSKVLQYMHSNPLTSKKDPNDFFAPVKFILTKGLALENIRDEIYCQLIKQSSNNPNLDLNNRAWELIHYCTATFPPSRKLIKYAASYLKSTINAAETPKSIKDSASASYLILQRFSLNSARKLIPSLGELESLKDNRPIFVRVTAADGSLKGVHVDSATTIAEAVDDLSIRCRMRAKDNGFSIMEFFNGIERDLAPTDKLSDVLSKVENLQVTLGPKINLNFKFLFKKRTFAINDKENMSAPEKDLYFNQLYSDLLNGGYIANVDFMILIGSFRLQADSSDYTDEIKNWLPGAGRGKYLTADIEKNKFDDFIHSYKQLKGIPQTEAKKRLLDAVFSHPLAYHSLFLCEHQMPENSVVYPKHFVLAVNHTGVHIFDMNSKLIDTIKYTQVSSNNNVKTTEKTITIVLENKVNFEIQTGEASKIAQVIKDYTLYLKNNAKYARALRDYNVSDPSLLSFKRNDIITITIKDSENKWYIGQLNGAEGSFPVDHVEILLTDNASSITPLPPISNVSSPYVSPMLGTPPPPPPGTNALPSNLPPPISLNNTPPPQLGTPPPQLLTPPLANPRASVSLGNRSSLTNSGDLGLNPDGSEDISKRASISPNLSVTDPIISWAQSRFRFFKKVGTLKKKPTDMNAVIYFTKDTIKESMIELDASLSKKAVKNFTDVMNYMGDLPLPKGHTISRSAQSIIKRGLESPELRDEIYVQVYRQTNKNPKLESTKRGFELLYFIAICFPPSESFAAPFSETLMTRSISLQTNNQALSQQIAAILEKVESHPVASQIARKQGPSMFEIQSIRSAADSGDFSTCKVRFVDQSTKLSKIATNSTVKEVLDDVLRQAGISAGQSKNFGIFQCNDLANICSVVSDSDLIYDVFAKWEQLEEKGDFFLQVRRRYYMDDVAKILSQENLWTDDEVSFELTFKQIREEWMRSQYITMNEKDISNAAAILIQLDYPNQSKLQFTKELLRQIIPDTLFNTQNIKFWTSQIEAHIFELVSHTPEYLKLLFIQLIGSKCSIFGCTLFNVQQKENPPKALMGISRKGINIFDPTTKESKHFFTFQSISNWTFTDSTFVIMSGNLMKPTKNTYTTDEYSSISLVYQHYSS